jgi:hypothetical protein
MVPEQVVSPDVEMSFPLEPLRVPDPATVTAPAVKLRLFVLNVHPEIISRVPVIERLLKVAPTDPEPEAPMVRLFSWFEATT